MLETAKSYAVLEEELQRLQRIGVALVPPLVNAVDSPALPRSPIDLQDSELKKNVDSQ